MVEAVRESADPRRRAGAARPGPVPTLDAVEQDTTGKRRGLPAWAVFSVLRVLFFLVPLVVVYAFSANLLVAAGIATVVGLCLSVIFLSRQRRAFSGELAATRGRPERPRRPSTGEDENAEDAAVDGTAGQNASAAANPRP